MNRHKRGITRINNIHHPRNLVALCHICHYAWDNDQWTFIPVDTAEWTEQIKTTPHIIEEYNARPTNLFRRLLLVPDPEFSAYKDPDYRSAFNDRPTGTWSGEPGVLISRGPIFIPEDPTPELEETLDDFAALQKLWLRYRGSCSEEDCPLCRSNNDEKQEEDNKDDEDERNEEDDEEDDGEDGGENKEGGEDDDEDGEDDSEEYDEDDGENDSEDDGENNSEADEEVDDRIRSSRRSRKRTFKIRSDSTGPPQDFGTKKSTQTSKYRRSSKNKERDWMTTEPYDESVPLSHRYGYTWANLTANDIMAYWQAYRKPAVD